MVKEVTARRAVRVYCAEHDTTQTRLAIKLGIDPGLFSHIINGVRPPTDEQIALIQNETGIDLREFVGAA